MSVVSLPSHWDKCRCPELNYVRRIISASLCVGTQCGVCGKYTAMRKAQFLQLGLGKIEDLPEFDAETRKRYWESRCEDWEREKAKERIERSKNWWSRYDEYMRSPEWQTRRTKVLERADGFCESCMEHPATQVHHLTYDHFGDEPCFDLRAVCAACHENITRMDRERRGA